MRQLLSFDDGWAAFRQAGGVRYHNPTPPHTCTHTYILTTLLALCTFLTRRCLRRCDGWGGGGGGGGGACLPQAIELLGRWAGCLSDDKRVVDDTLLLATKEERGQVEAERAAAMEAAGAVAVAKLRAALQRTSIGTSPRAADSASRPGAAADDAAGTDGGAHPAPAPARTPLARQPYIDAALEALRAAVADTPDMRVTVQVQAPDKARALMAGMVRTRLRSHVVCLFCHVFLTKCVHRRVWWACVSLAGVHFAQHRAPHMGKCCRRGGEQRLLRVL